MRFRQSAYKCAISFSLQFPVLDDSQQIDGEELCISATVFGVTTRLQRPLCHVRLFVRTVVKAKMKSSFVLEQNQSIHDTSCNGMEIHVEGS